MARDFCWSCRRPREACLCPSAPPLPTATRIVLLMHPMEWKREKCTTGRLACLNLANSEIIPGLDFDPHPRFRALVDDPANLPLLLYPGEGALDLSAGGFPEELHPAGPGSAPEGGEGRRRRLVVFLIDATWACARVIARRNPGLMSLGRIMFLPRERSRWTIKKQPEEWCLSTIEAIHELLLALEAAGLDRYDDKERLLATFMAMQGYQEERRRSAPGPRFLIRKGGD